MLVAATGSWHATFVIAAVLNVLAGLAAWFVLRPMRRGFVLRSASPASA